jgi:hypothetical protein
VVRQALRSWLPVEAIIDVIDTRSLTIAALRHQELGHTKLAHYRGTSAAGG